MKCEKCGEVFPDEQFTDEGCPACAAEVPTRFADIVPDFEEMNFEKLYAPDGKQIIGILESVQLTQFIVEEGKLKPDQTIEAEYAGENKVHWDSSEPIDSEKGRVFVDSAHNTWHERDVWAHNYRLLEQLKARRNRAGR